MKPNSSTVKVRAKDFYALLCFSSGNDQKPKPMLCGVFSTKKEAEGCARDVKGCATRHKIVKCDVSIAIRDVHV